MVIEGVDCADAHKLVGVAGFRSQMQLIGVHFGSNQLLVEGSYWDLVGHLVRVNGGAGLRTGICRLGSVLEALVDRGVAHLARVHLLEREGQLPLVLLVHWEGVVLQLYWRFSSILIGFLSTIAESNEVSLCLLPIINIAARALGVF